jgi:hypothetical protein
MFRVAVAIATLWCAAPAMHRPAAQSHPPNIVFSLAVDFDSTRFDPLRADEAAWNAVAKCDPVPDQNAYFSAS